MCVSFICFWTKTCVDGGCSFENGGRCRGWVNCLTSFCLVFMCVCMYISVFYGGLGREEERGALELGYFTRFWHQGYGLGNVWFLHNLLARVKLYFV